MAEQTVMEFERQVKAMRAALNRIANFARRHNEPYDEEIINGGWDVIARIATDALREVSDGKTKDLHAQDSG